MRAVWSFWGRPFASPWGRGRWFSERHHLLSWVLSLETARRHYPDTVLVTDGDGARMLVDGLGLGFGRVSTGLDVMAGSDPALWALGKLYAVAEQDAPFVHVDGDVFLWRPLPERLARTPVFTQNPEPLGPHTTYYRPGMVEAALQARPGGWVPEEWSWYLGSGLPLRGDCCGIVGGQAVDFLRHWARAAIRMVEHPGNRAAWESIEHRELDMVSVEQFFLSACVERHAREGGPFAGVRMEHLFATCDEAFTPGVAEALGYTHLIAGAKHDDELMARLEARVARDHPHAYERCLRWLRDTGAERRLAA